MFFNICKSFSQAYSFICVTIIFFSFFFDQSSKGLVDFILKKIFFYAITVVPIIPPSLPSTQSTPPSIVNPHTIVCVHGSFIYVLCLILSPSFNQSSPLSLAFDWFSSFPLTLSQFCRPLPYRQWRTESFQNNFS